MGKVDLNIEIDADLLDQARRLDIDIEEATADGLRRALVARKSAAMTDAERAADAGAWATENADTLEAYRRRIERDGVFGEDFRTW